MGVKQMLEKVKQALKSGDAKKKKETSRINLEAELDEVRAMIDAKAIEADAEERRAAKAGNGK